MSRKLILGISSCAVLLGAAACDKAEMTEPGSANAFTGKWVGVKRLVSCTPAGPLCALQPMGVETYFQAMLNQQGEAVDGSVDLSEGGPLALPYGFFIKGQISSAGQLAFERYFTFDVGEPPYSGHVGITISLGRQLTGQMTKGASASDTLTLVWQIEAARR